MNKMAATSDKSPPGPFTTPDKMTDVTFIVEDQKLYFNKTILQMSSAVFDRMFTSGFKESEAKEILLPGKEYDHVVNFLKQIHPAHCAEPITDQTLTPLLQLADEYQVDSVRKKCELYIGTQLTILGQGISEDSLLFYLALCDQHRLSLYRNDLMELAFLRRLSDLQQSRFYSDLPMSVQLEITTIRCLKLEKFVCEALPRIKAMPDTPQDKCPFSCRDVFGRRTALSYCKSCVVLKVKELFQHAPVPQ